MPAVVTFTISSLLAGTRVTYSSANSRTPAVNEVNADANGLVTLTLGNAANVIYRVTLPDGHFGYLPVQTTTGTVSVGTISVYKQGVPPGLEDITSLFVAAMDATTTTAALALKQTKVTKIYAANFTQVGTGAPTVSLFLNELSAAVVWTYVIDGTYRGTLAGAFPAAKTPTQGGLFGFGTSGGTGSLRQWMLERENDDAILLKTYDSTDVLVDGLLTAQYLQFTFFV